MYLVGPVSLPLFIINFCCHQPNTICMWGKCKYMWKNHEILNTNFSVLPEFKVNTLCLSLTTMRKHSTGKFCVQSERLHQCTLVEMVVSLGCSNDLQCPHLILSLTNNRYPTNLLGSCPLLPPSALNLEAWKYSGKLSCSFSVSSFDHETETDNLSCNARI